MRSVGKCTDKGKIAERLGIAILELFSGLRDDKIRKEFIRRPDVQGVIARNVCDAFKQLAKK